LIFERFFEVALFDWDTETYVLTGPPVVARSRAGGTFSFEDSVVDDGLRRACQRSPRVDVATLLELFGAAVCSRLQRTPLAMTEAAYRARCRQLKARHGAAYPSEYMAMCQRGTTTVNLTDDLPTSVHDLLAAIDMNARIDRDH
jgi:hypothetical protein